MIYESLLLNKYCYLFLDEYYISASAAYQLYHRIHDSLIYGYDSENDSFLAIAMNKNQQLDKLIYPAHEVTEAFKHFVSHEYEKIIRHTVFFKESDPRKQYSFSAKRFLSELESYITGADKSETTYFTTAPVPVVSYGINAEKSFLHRLTKKKVLYFYVFRSLYFLYEHKKNLYRRFLYVHSLYPSLSLKESIERFQTVIRDFDKTRLLEMKYRVLQEQPNNVTSQYEFKNKITASLSKAIENERDILIDIFEEIKKAYYMHNDMVMHGNITTFADCVITDAGQNGRFVYPYEKSFSFSWSDRTHFTFLDAETVVVVGVAVCRIPFLNAHS